MSALTEERLAEIEARAQAATPGLEVGGPYPATSLIRLTDPGSCGPDPYPPEYECVALLDDRREGEPNPHARADAELFAHARETELALVAEVRRLREALLDAAAHLHRCHLAHGSDKSERAADRARAAANGAT